MAIPTVVDFVAGELFCESVLKTPLPPVLDVADVGAPVPVAAAEPSTIEPPGMRGMVGFIYCIS